MTNKKTKTCQVCGGALGPVFCQANNVPVHSCLMLDNAAEATQFPKGDVRLTACPTCGTITNLDFDSKWSAYSPVYEDRQAFSPTFNSFAGKLAQDLVRRHDLAGKTVLDIGCSKGDFLAQLCAAGAAKGIGIDPSAPPGVQPVENGGTLELIGAPYSEEHIAHPAALISNRHTLEHIDDVSDMLKRMHRHAVAAGNAVTFIEVPNMTRVLRDLAFEDIYYEHCSYFTPGTLARALRLAGFGVQRLWLDYDDQYLLAEAVTDPKGDHSFEIEETPTEVLQMLEEFHGKAVELKSRWKAYIEQAAHTGKKIAIWGSGSKCIAFWYALDMPDAVYSIVDINPHRWGKYVPGLPLPVSRPAQLQDDRPDVVIAMNAIYLDEIESDLAGMGITVEVIALEPAADLRPGAKAVNGDALERMSHV